MSEEQLNLDLNGHGRSPLMRRIAAMVAPVAADAGAVVSDEEPLAVARAVCEAFAHDDAVGGLTKAEIAARVNGTCTPAQLEQRLGVFVRMELLRPILDKKHQQRYVLAPAGLVGTLIVDRFAERGGVEELLGLLDRTKRALERHDADEPAVAAALESCRATFAVFANELTRLVSDAPLSDLLAERRFHDDEDYVAHVGELQKLVTDEFPALDPAAYKLLLEAQRYVDAVQSLLERVLDEGGETRNLQLLDPEEYLQAARAATLDELAEVTGHLVFDAAAPCVDAGDILEAVESYRPRRTSRTRPPEPAASPDPDPIAELHRRVEQTTRRRVLQAESLLGGRDEAELTDTLRAAGWPAAAKLLADLLVLDGLPEQPFHIRLGEALLVDAEAALTYTSPVHLGAERQPLAPIAPPVAGVAAETSGG
ncbi:MAG: hypothetical protein ACRDM7_01480 [Thermoleophilaceae bacterium]